MKHLILAMALVVLLVVPMSSYSETTEFKSEVSTSILSLGEPQMLAQNANYIPCYKQEAGKMILFRWCPNGLPYTATNNMRTTCYETSHACAEAEMPQSWCIKCGSKD